MRSPKMFSFVAVRRVVCAADRESNGSPMPQILAMPLMATLSAGGLSLEFTGYVGSDANIITTFISLILNKFLCFQSFLRKSINQNNLTERLVRRRLQ